MERSKTVNRFGFDVHGGKDEYTSAIVRILVRDVENLVIGPHGPEATVAISPHLMAPIEIDNFVDSAVAELEKIRTEAKSALKEINPRRSD